VTNFLPLTYNKDSVGGSLKLGPSPEKSKKYLTKDKNLCTEKYIG